MLTQTQYDAAVDLLTTVFPNGIPEEVTAPSEDGRYNLLELPHFKSLAWITSFRLKTIDPAQVKPGSYNCIFSMAFNGWDIGSAMDVARLAQSDYHWYLSNIVGMRVVGVGPAKSLADWHPPGDFGGEFQNLAATTMNWNDEGYTQDHEKRLLLGAAIHQELDRRAVRYH